MCHLILVLFIATASPANYFGGPTSRCLCNCPNPGLGNDVCAREAGGPQEMFPSKCYLECYNCTYGREYVVIHKQKCQRRG